MVAFLNPACRTARPLVLAAALAPALLLCACATVAPDAQLVAVYRPPVGVIGIAPAAKAPRPVTLAEVTH